MRYFYNVVGDQLFLPFGNAKGQAVGVRASHFEGLSAGNFLAFAANANVMAWLRRTKPCAYKHLNLTIFSQNDVENYNSEMSQHMGLMHSKALFVHRRNSSALFVHQQFCLFVVSVKQLNSFRIRAERSPTLYQLYKKYRAG